MNYMNYVDRLLAVLAQHPAGIHFHDVAHELPSDFNPEFALIDLSRLGLTTIEEGEDRLATITDTGLRALRTSIADESDIRQACLHLSRDARRFLAVLRAFYAMLDRGGETARYPLLNDHFARMGIRLDPSHPSSFERADAVLRDLYDAGIISSLSVPLPRTGIGNLGVDLRYAGWLCLERWLSS